MTSYNVGPARLFEGTAGDPGIRNAWAPPTSSVTTLMQVFIAGLVQVDLTGVTTYTLSALGNTADQSRPAIIEFIGTPSGDCTVTLPTAAASPGWAINATAGGHNVILTSGGGTTAIIPPTGFWVYYYSDGAGDVNLVPVEYSSVTTTNGLFTPSGLFQIAPNFYMQRNPSDGAWRWVENGVVNMTLDAAGDWSNAGSAFVGTTLGVGGNAYFTNDGNFIIYKSAGRPTYQFTAGAYMLWDGANIEIEPGIVTNNITVAGSVSVGATINTPSITVSQGYFGIAPNYYLQRSPSDGAWRWVDNSTVNMTLDPIGNLGARTSVNAPTVNGTNFGASNAYFVGSTATSSYFAWAGGSPILNLAPSNYIQYNGNMSYNTTGQHIFTGGIVSLNESGSGPFGGGWSYNLSGPAGPTPPQTFPISLGCASNVIAANFFAGSDERIKSDITDITPEEADRFIGSTRPVVYLKDGTWEAGLIAQEVIRAGYGKFVVAAERAGMERIEYPDGLVIEEGALLQLDRANPVAYLLAFCKQQSKEMARLSSRVEELEKIR